MDALYQGIEASLLALALVLGLAVAGLPHAPPAGPTYETTLPMISVAADAS